MKHVIIFISVISLFTLPASAGWTVTNLNPLPGVNSVIRGISQDFEMGATNNHAGYWQGTAGSWVDLHPIGASISQALGGFGNQQVGTVSYPAYVVHASLWTGSAGSWVDLNPPNSGHRSLAYDSNGEHQVGEATIDGQYVAGMWSGTAESWVNLNPVGYFSSSARTITDGQQAGYAFKKITANSDEIHAGFWQGTAQSWVDLHPAGSTWSQAADTSASQQVGMAIFPGDFNDAFFGKHAIIWNSSPDNWIDLNPSRFYSAGAISISNGYQVGSTLAIREGVNGGVLGGQNHAAIWHGTAESWVDLHSFLPNGMADQSVATGIYVDGDRIRVVGYGVKGQYQVEPLLWEYNVPEPTGLLALSGALLSLGVLARRKTN